jgi:NAD(P)H-dependent flavin oxidoreductase YrpB (nitropropane dioxygenase family)
VDGWLAAFGVDLLIPSLGPNARKTNYDYAKGKLDELIDVIIEEKTKLFVCAVGVPPKEVVDKLHKAGIFVMNVCSLLIYLNGRWSADGRTP